MFEDPYNEGFYQLGKIFVKRYAMGEFQLEMLSKSVFCREALVEVYNVMVRKGGLKKIEDLDEETKEEWRQHVKPYIAELSNKEARKLIKSIYILNKLSE